MKRTRVAVVAACALLAAVFLALLLPALSAGNYDGWPRFAVRVDGLPADQLASIRFVEVSSKPLLDALGTFSDEELLALSKAPTAVEGSSVIVSAWFGGRRGLFSESYNQTYAVLLLVRREGKGLLRKTVVLPDLRESKSTQVVLP